MKSVVKLLTQLINTPSVSSYEKILEISPLVANQLAKICSTKVAADGSVIAQFKRKPKRPIILISAHLDEVGFFISKKLSRNRYRILPLGEISTSRIIGSQTNLGRIRSSIKNPASYNQIYLESDQKKVQLLDPVYWLRKVIIKGSLIKAPALDNKVGITALLLLAERLSRSPNYNFVFAAIAQEEVGSKIYQNLINQTKPSLIIDIDSAYGISRPNKAAANIPILGQGAAIQIIGKNLNPEKSWLQQVINFLKKERVKFQLEIPGPNEGETLLSQVDYTGKFLQVNIPVSNQHEPISSANLDDIVSSVNLVELMLKSLSYD